MYFPYLRGKRYELLAIRESAAGIKASGKIFPVIEPVRTNVNELSQALEDLRARSIPYVFVVNPTVGQFRRSPQALGDMIGRGEIPLHGKAALAYILTKDTATEDVEGFLNLYDGRHLALLHCHRFPDPGRLIALSRRHRSVRHILLDRPTGREYQEASRGQRRILVTDPFRKRSNTDYADAPDEFFSNAHNTFAADGWHGFGDFSVVGKRFSDGGGGALAVTLHLIYQRGGEELRVRHFISDTNGSKGNDRLKYFEALTKLVRFLDEHPEIDTSATREFRDRLRRREYDNLGHPKRLSINHHLEVMMKIL
jgi:hypothetical protein